MYKNRLMSMRARVEAAISHPIDAERARTVPSLYELPPDLLMDLHQLMDQGLLVQVAYIDFYLADEHSRDTLMEFIDEVVRSGKDLATWRCSPALCYPDTAPWSRILSADETVILAPLQLLEGQRWLRIPPDSHEWEASGSGGAPAVLLPRIDYRWRAPTGVRGLRLSSPVTIERIDDLEIALRRWVASGVAYALRPQHAEESVYLTLDDMCQTLGVAKGCLSEFGIRVLRGLEQENRLLGPTSEMPGNNPLADSEKMPGFRGPDAWFR